MVIRRVCAGDVPVFSLIPRVLVMGIVLLVLSGTAYAARYEDVLSTIPVPIGFQKADMSLDSYQEVITHWNESRFDVQAIFIPKGFREDIHSLPFITVCVFRLQKRQPFTSSVWLSMQYAKLVFPRAMDAELIEQGSDYLLFIPKPDPRDGEQPSAGFLIGVVYHKGYQFYVFFQFDHQDITIQDAGRVMAAYLSLWSSASDS